MRYLSDTVARLTRMNRARADWAAPEDERQLSTMEGFGTNPGGLVARLHIPAGLPRQAPLVVVLHGCTQDATGYDRGAGWSALADRHRFAVLFPEQQRANNASRCFNWFEPGDSRRDGGEALSIRQMVESCVVAHGIDRRRVFVCGLSAGGAMTSVLLASYPEVFAAGAIIAGLPFGCAASIPQAFDRMRGHGLPEAGMLEAALRRASPHSGRWPAVSVWHGTADQTVSPANMTAIIDQWRGVHGVGVAPTRTEQVDGFPRRVWCDVSGRERIEAYSITRMGHGTPVDAEGNCGVAGPYMLDVGICSTKHIARFWGLLAAEQDNAVSRGATAAPAEAPRGGTAIRKVIDTALRTAGLLR